MTHPSPNEYERSRKRVDVDPYAFCEGKYLRNAGVQGKLRKAVCKRTRRYLWTPADAVTFIPALSNRLYGDGRALPALTTINSRPRFYVLRIDSACHGQNCRASG